jgi:hypothetical protein
LIRCERTGAAGLLSQQLDGLHNDLLAFAAKAQRRFDRIDQGFDQIERRSTAST